MVFYHPRAVRRDICARLPYHLILPLLQIYDGFEHGMKLIFSLYTLDC